VNPWLQFIIAVLATWRVTHLLAREDGPADVLVRLRGWLGEGFAGRLMDCFHCLSLWVAAPMALVLDTKPLGWLVAWLALSGAACLLDRFGREPVIIQPLTEPKEGEQDHGMLRTRPDDNPEHDAGVAQNSAQPGESNSLS
jgi:hypothetical protein